MKHKLAFIVVTTIWLLPVQAEEKPTYEKGNVKVTVQGGNATVTVNGQKVTPSATPTAKAVAKATPVKAPPVKASPTKTAPAKNPLLKTPPTKTATKSAAPVSAPDLVGEWFVADNSAALQNTANPSSFTITRVVPEKAPYWDGYFLWKWRGQPGLSKGHYSNQTGRAWFLTERVYDGARIPVQYSGRIARGKTLQLQGSVSKTRGTENVSWMFTATRQKR